MAACVTPGGEAVSPSAQAKASDALWHSLDDGNVHPIIVALDDTQSAPIWAEAKKRMIDEAPAAELALDREWEQLPLMLVHASSVDAAAAMFDHDEVIAAFEPERLEMSDAESFPLIDQPAAIATGHAGSGTSVAILDTGTDYTRAAFGSCTAPGVPAGCKVTVAMDFAPDDGALDANSHGTNVAGITLGVAPDTRILALDVFDGSGAWNTDIISAINWSIANKAKYSIAAMNLSLGGGSSTAPCTSDPLGIALGSARTAGIAPVVAAGNGGMSNALSSPGCAPAAISVGAVYDSSMGGIGYSNCTDSTTAADKITCFSNSASFLTVLAPGAMITAAGITMAGTSQASPHVAGAMAILRGTYPTETVDQLVARLTASGKPIKDSRNNVTKPRIDIAAALAKATPDTTAPTGSLSINGGATMTKSLSVALSITSADAAQMCITNTTTCTSFSAFAPTKTWTLATGTGTRTVKVFLRDAAGNATTSDTSPTASITLDGTAPTNGTVTVTAGNASLHLTWTGFADVGTGITSYRVVGGATATAPANCAGTALYTGTDHGFTQSSLTNGTRYSYRVCAVDGAGNMSTGITATAIPAPETTAPSGTIAINGGAVRTNNLTVTLALTATDASGVTKMCISESTTCTAFIAFAASPLFKLSTTNGNHIVRAWFQDPWSNTSAPVTASIVLDTVAPSGGTLSATASPGKIALTWTVATDSTSGLDGYRLVGAVGATAPASCTAGTLLYAGTATSFSHEALGPNAKWSYRLCANDKAGNMSAGSTKTATTPQ